MSEQLKYGLDRLESTPVLAVVAMTGHCLGAGTAVASVRDLRVADGSGRFGGPITKTVRQCLSLNTCSLLVARLGRRMERRLARRSVSDNRLLARETVGMRGGSLPVACRGLLRRTRWQPRSTTEC